MYIGSISNTKKEMLILQDNKFVYKEVEYNPGFMKIFDEILDNSIDEAIRTNFQHANTISITYNKGSFTIEDNGRGVPQQPSLDGTPQAVIAFTEARAGSNFDEATKANGIGTNGIGSYLTNVYSTKFSVETSDGKNTLTLKCDSNAINQSYDIKKSKKQGTKVSFTPDLEKFGMSQIDDIYFELIMNRTFHLSQSFPLIKFNINFNEFKEVKVMPTKKYLEMFSDNFEFIQTDNYFFAVLPNEFDDFRLFSYVNGLNISSGGSHINYLAEEVISRIRIPLSKKYKEIKPGDIKNKIMIVCLMKEFPNLKFDSQTKEKVTNSITEIKNYLGDIDFDSLSKKLLKNEAIISPITEVYKIKEELKKRQELKGLEKKVKRIVSEKYLPATNLKKYLIIGEGTSAISGLVPVLGREVFGYYELKGKPLNAYTADQSKFSQNKELSELYKIIINENYEYIVIGSDADIDAQHIRALLIGFVETYLKDYKSKLGVLYTPVICVKKNNQIVRWYYDFNAEVSLKNGEISKWMKGLGSWKDSDLKYVISKDGINNMIKLYEFDDLNILDDWLNDKSSDKRKEYIRHNEFSIAKL